MALLMGTKTVLFFLLVITNEGRLLKIVYVLSQMHNLAFVLIKQKELAKILLTFETPPVLAVMKKYYRRLSSLELESEFK